jgi:hypothetical protein
MKKRFLLIAIISVFIIGAIVGCGGSAGTGGTGTTATGNLRLLAIDAPPPPGNVEQIFLTVNEIRVHKTGGGWMTISDTPVTLDFLQLVNGVTGILADEELPVGKYTQLRLILERENEIVIDGETYPLVVPSGQQTGVKINLDFEILENEIIEIVVDFDASKSIVWTPGNYKLKPSFRAFKMVLSGTISGVVCDEHGEPIANALVEAIPVVLAEPLNMSKNLDESGEAEEEDEVISIGTLTNEYGQYMLILTEGIYDLQASAEGFVKDGATHKNIQVTPGEAVTEVNFDLVTEEAVVDMVSNIMKLDVK